MKDDKIKIEFRRAIPISATRLHSESVRPRDMIDACTVRANEPLTVLSQHSVDQADNMEPLPQFSRNRLHSTARYAKALKQAQKAEKEQKEKAEKE